MEDYTSLETVKEKLIIAGIKELQNHGIADFSLRRVASLCNVSCAAPYKHFKSKEDFIGEIMLYIHNRWNLLKEQVIEACGSDITAQILEICIAYIKFFIANPSFRSVILIRTDDISDIRYNNMFFSEQLNELIVKLYEDETVQKNKEYIISSLVYGASLMLDNGYLKNDAQTLNMIRETIKNQLKA